MNAKELFTDEDIQLFKYFSQRYNAKTFNHPQILNNKPINMPKGQAHGLLDPPD